MLIQVKRFLLSTDTILNITGISDYRTHAFFDIESFGGKEFHISVDCLDIWSEITGGIIEYRQGFWPDEFKDKRS